MITVRLPDGSAKELHDGATGLELASSIGRRLAKAAVAVSVDGAPVDLGTPLPDGAEVAVITEDTDAGRAVLRHSTAHVLAQAVLELWPGAHYAIGPAIADGFYYDFELPGGATFSDDDLERIEEKMRAIMAADQPFVREEHSVEEGLALFADQPFKREIIEGVAGASPDAALSEEASGDIAPDAAAVSAYRNDGFVDLCRGPHVASTGRLGHFKLLRVAGAYWRGDEHRPQLQRIYGTAWESDRALAEHLHRLEEAERRDHRRIGAELDLFSFPTEIGSGLAIFHPKGATIRRLMEEYSRQRHIDGGYEFAYTPHIAKSELFEISGHLDWFAESMYPPMELDEGQRYYLKPMNCPFHVLVYRSRQRSYRELPLRLFEFGTVYRYEKSGVVHGLTRVRGMTQDDAHIFCTRPEMGEELGALLTFVLDLLRDFGLEDFYLELSTRPPGKGAGDRRGVGRGHRGAARRGRGSGARARDGRGRGRVLRPQDLGAGPRRHRPVLAGVDHPARLPDPSALRPGVRRRRQRPAPARHDPPRPVRVGGAFLRHPPRALRGGVAHVAHAGPGRGAAGARPHDDYARHVAAALRAAQVRVEVDSADEPLNARIRRWKLEKVPYVLVVGDDDVAAGTVGVNPRGSQRPDRGVALEEFVAELCAEIADRGSPERGGDLGPEASVSE